VADDKPAAYDELIEVLANLRFLVRETRRRRGLSIRATAEQLGLSHTVISRFEEGAGVQLGNAITLLRWVAAPDSRED
jgi:ribosome-binding protein aMBF1 (putative translation factor)